MTEQQVQVVVRAEAGGVVQQLLQVVAEQAGMELLDRTARGVELSVVGVIDVCGTCLVEVVRTVDRQGQAVVEVEVGKAVARVGVTLVGAGVQRLVHPGVSIAHEGASVSGIRAVTVVGHAEAVAVNHNLALAVANPEGVDGGHLHSRCPDVTGVGLATVVAQAVVLEACV